MFTKFPLLNQGKASMGQVIDGFKRILKNGDKSYLSKDVDINKLNSLSKAEIRAIIYGYMDSAIKISSEGKSVPFPRCIMLNVRSLFIKGKSYPIVTFDTFTDFKNRILPNYEKYKGLSIAETYDVSKSFKKKKDWESKIVQLETLVEAGYTYSMACREIKFYQYQEKNLNADQIVRINKLKN